MRLWKASGIRKNKFALSVGLSGSQLTNISRFRNPPAHTAISKASRIYGVPVDFFYTESLAGVRDERLLDSLRTLITVDWRPDGRDE